MKKIKLIVIAVSLLIGCSLQTQAQAPYKCGIGFTAGNQQALSLKVFGGNHFAFQVDLGTRVTVADGNHARRLPYPNTEIWDLELNPNFMFEGGFTQHLYGFIGIGGSIGYCWNIPHGVDWLFGHVKYDSGKCGANGIFGLEYKFNAPIAIQFDFRPGYGCLFAEHFDAHYFDWAVNFGFHYTIR